MSEPAVRLLVVLTTFSSMAAIASPLEAITSMSLDWVPPEQDLLLLEQRHARHWVSESESLTETTRTLQFYFGGTPGDFAPAWSIEHHQYDLDAERDGYRLSGTGQEDTLGFGFTTPNQHRLLLGPDRYEWQKIGPDGQRYTIGWVSPRQRRSLRVSKDSDTWQTGFHNPADAVYMAALRDNQALLLSYGDEYRWSVAYNHGRFGVAVERDAESWPVLTDQWQGDNVSLRRFELEHHRLAGHYRLESGLIDSFGLSMQHWQVDTQAIVPYDDMPGSIQGSGELKAQDLWVDIANDRWRSRWLLRHASPDGSGVHYPVYFPGLGERWPEPDMDYALLGGLRLDYARELGPAARLEVWVQQWWPLYIARSGDSASPDDSGGSGGGDSGGNGAVTNQGSGHDFGGFQFGVRLRLPWLTIL